MEITQVVLDAYNRDGIECELLNPNKQCKFRKGSIVKPVTYTNLTLPKNTTVQIYDVDEIPTKTITK